MIMAAGAKHKIAPTGPSQIRRVEAGIFSYFQDMRVTDNPFEIGMDRLVDLEMEADFVGKEALKKIKQEGIKRKLVGIEILGDPISKVVPPQYTPGYFVPDHWPVFDDKKVDFSKHDKGKNEFTFKLPATKVELTYKFLTQRDERDIDEELKAMKKINKGSGVDPEITTRMKKTIIAIDGERNRTKVNKFVDEQFLSVDSLEFRRHLQETLPDVDMSYLFECSLCAYEEEMTVPMTVAFLWPAARR